ncbi:MAG TPA: DUF1329 domain-containing protein [Noviherbaspirillum sp.]|nr:DUF1329 domain-containing protein [Noviherbaspirillum sp.]
MITSSRGAKLLMISGMTLLCLSQLPASGQQRNVTGAQLAGNADASIPPWRAGVAGPLPGWTEGKSRIRFAPYANEKPLYVIDQRNIDRYAPLLPPGAIALLRKKPGYTMPVYPTHRSCGVPNFVAENTERHRGAARIAANGWSLENAVLPSIPFPSPRSGIEALWNYLLLYQGVGYEWLNNRVYLSPYNAGDEPIIFNADSRTYFPWAAPGQRRQQPGDLKQGLQIFAKYPPSLNGQVIFQRFYFEKATESSYFHPAQRRVRRMPSYAYDAPIIGFERTYPNDSIGIFSGNPDRFEWTLKGKRELLIPYNVFNFTDKDAEGNSIFGRDYIVATARRYELHRVWEVEGKLRSGMRHSTPRKVLYLDEDSWAVAAGEDYDADGNLVRYKESAVVPIWEINACTSQFSMILYDFVQNRYLRDGYVTDEKDLKFHVEANAPWMRPDEFTESALRRRTGY